MPNLRVAWARWVRVVGLCAMAGVGSFAWSAELSVAVAANFMAPMHKLAAAFERDTGHRLRLSFGSTGRMVAQIRHGAPFDVFLAADEEGPIRLVQERLAAASSRHTYAIGRLVLWSLQPGLVDARGEVLRRAEVGHLAIADPKLAPYGRASVQVLDSLGLRALWARGLVQGESITQAHQFVASGNAALGLVALSQVFEGERLIKGSAWVVPAQLHSPIRQDMVLLTRGQSHPAAAAFMAYMRSEAARVIIRRAGYEL
jgi:molybdate transport system substrate-binding protein